MSTPGGPGSITAGAPARSPSQRSQITAPTGRGDPQAAHNGGATSEIIRSIGEAATGRASGCACDDWRVRCRGSRLERGQLTGNQARERAMGRFDISPQMAEEWRAKYRSSVEPHVDGEVLAGGAFPPTSAGPEMAVSKMQVGAPAPRAAPMEGKNKRGGRPG